MYKLDFTGYEHTIPLHTQMGLRRYVEEGYMPGGFLTAVLCNDLMRATASADSENKDALFDICQFVYNRMPDTSWGSAQKMRTFVESYWQAKKVLEEHEIG